MLSVPMRMAVQELAPYLTHVAPGSATFRATDVAVLGRPVVKCRVLQFAFTGGDAERPTWEELEARANRIAATEHGLTRPARGMTTRDSTWDEHGKWVPIITQVYYP